MGARTASQGNLCQGPPSLMLKRTKAQEEFVPALGLLRSICPGPGLASHTPEQDLGGTVPPSRDVVGVRGPGADLPGKTEVRHLDRILVGQQILWPRMQNNSLD